MKWKRIIVIIMVCLLISSATVEAHAAAEAGVLSVLGGSVAAGGIGAAVAAIAPPAIIIVGLALAAQGIYVSISEESEKLGMTKSDYIGTKLAQFALDSGKQYSDVCHDIVDGANVSSTGSIALTNAASNTIYQFINSLVANDEINPPISGEKHIMMGDISVPVISTNETITYFIRYGTLNINITNLSQHDYACFVGDLGVGKQYYMLSNQPIFYYYYQGTSNGTYNQTGRKVGDMYALNFSAYEKDAQTLVPYVPNWEAIVQSWGTDFNVSSGDVDEDQLNSANPVDSSVYNPDAGDVVVLNPGLDLPGIAQVYGKTGTIAIDNYLESLKRALDGVQNNTIAISNTLTGVLDNVAVGTYDPVGSATADQVAEEDLPRVLTPVIDLTANPSGSAAENSLKGLQFDLTAIFPFCIPFDIVALIQKFDVQPETPAISVSLPLPGVNTTLDLDLDLSPFETVARILRTMELIAFIVGLMMVTRHLIRG